ncbi:MAG: PTS sugar transporter [Deltaproteobacteria bacterium]|nr:PTS sugar transporter [Deltaproteobacteria bacterium]MBI4948578.1 PTS sugar transporter [Deltaproteobacteria bacterium]
MIGAVIITHGALAGSLKEAAETIAGKIDGIKTVSVTRSDTTESVRALLAASIKAVNSGNGAIVFTDMFGGTPTNIALSFMEDGKVEVITGVNLPMILKFVGHRTEKGLSGLAVMLKEYGQSSIVLAGDILKERK